MPMGDNIREEMQGKEDGLRAVNRMLREQNWVLANALKLCVERLEGLKEDGITKAEQHALDAAQAALTATSPPVKPAGKMHACDIPGCVSCGNPEDATSQEGQHEA